MGSSLEGFLLLSYRRSRKGRDSKGDAPLFAPVQNTAAVSSARDTRPGILDKGEIAEGAERETTPSAVPFQGIHPSRTNR